MTVSEREFQLGTGRHLGQREGVRYVLGPIGPWPVTREYRGFPTFNNLAMWLDVNGRRFQSGSTRTMIFRPDFLASYVSRFMTLLPGDIISTGTSSRRRHGAETAAIPRDGRRRGARDRVAGPTATDRG